MNVSLSSLERLLHRYTIEPTTKPFDVRSVPVEAVPVEQPKDISIGVGLPRPGIESKTNREDTYDEQLSAIPEFAHLGPIFKSSLPVDLTESEVEYVVRCIKNIFSHYIVFQLEDIEITVSDHVQKVLKPNWYYKIIIFYFSFHLMFIIECLKKIINYMGMQACERSDKILEGKASHALYLAGVYRGGYDVLVRTKMALGGTTV
ncbi:unnamed protein product [Rotaria sp. Silwood1]|nr:unnamed protein product [Rotaria sp. Silwood1]CAF1205936.1 unnamed protein product [Rotaria sp. Silwood1]CAF1209691.1 unnamed protein product [Rotaria sp. Silwood1]